MTDVEYLIDTLVTKRDELQCAIVNFSEYGRFPSNDDFDKICKLSLELKSVGYMLKKIEDLV